MLAFGGILSGCAEGAAESATAGTRTGAPACRPSAWPASARSLEWPGASWGAPADARRLGFDSLALSRVLRSVAATPQTALHVSVGGRLLAHVGDDSTPRYIASVRKSVLSILIGQQVQAGRLSLGATLESLGVDDIGGLLPIERTATVRDLLMSRSGVYHAASNPGDASADAPRRGSQRPGRYFLYNNWDFNALGSIYAAGRGLPIYDAIERDLARPIGMEDYDAGRQRLEGDLTRSRHPAYQLQLSTRDLARIGVLMLHRGQWGRRAVVPALWVDSSTAPLTPSREMHPASWAREGQAYGFLWWVMEAQPGTVWEGAYSAQGAGGQFLLVLPRPQLVLAHLTDERSSTRISWSQFLALACRIAEAAVPAAPTR